MEYDLELKIDGKISEDLDVVNKLIEVSSTKKRVLLYSDPGTGKTTFFIKYGLFIKKKSLNRKLILLLPFTIIQDQTKQEFNKYGIDKILIVDRNLAKIKKEEFETYDIVLSTFQGLSKINKHITESDLIVVDEAHTFLNGYRQKNGLMQYYSSTIYQLHTSKACVILMTGTPPSALNYLFDLYRVSIKQIKEVKKAKISLLLSGERSVIKNCILFANEIRGLEKNKIHCIYIKNKETCRHLAEQLILLGYNSKVLTSESKKSELYLHIEKKQLIEEGIDFLITTNVISTGANILNNNIGTCLMINEFNPLEIKQFSKRFRKHLDINIKAIYTRNIDSKDKFDEAISNRNITREYCQTVLKNIDKFTYNTKPFRIKNVLSNYSPIQVKKEIIYDFVMYESEYYKNLYNNAEIKLIQEKLDSFDDIETSFTALNLEGLNKIEIKELKNKFDTKFHNVVDDFIENTDEYLIAIRLNIDSLTNHYLAYQLVNSVTNVKPKKNIRDVVIENIKNPFFCSEIIDKIMDVIYYVSDVKKALLIIKYLNQKSFNELLRIVELNQSVFSAYQIDYENDNVTKGISLMKKAQFSTVHYNLDSDIKLILKSVFNYIADKDFFYMPDLKDTLESTENIIELLKSTNKKPFPLDLMPYDTDLQRYKLTSPIIKIFVSSLFLLKTKTSNKVIIRDDSNKKESKTCYVFANSKTFKKDYELQYLEYEKFGFNFPNFKKKISKIISNTDLLVQEAISSAKLEFERKNKN